MAVFRLVVDEMPGAGGSFATVPGDLGDTFAGPQLRPVKVGPALLADFDQMRRKRLLGDWAADMAQSG